MSATTSGQKSKLFGFLKGIFHKPDSSTASHDVSPDNTATPSAPPPPPLPTADARPVRNSNRSRNGNGEGNAARPAPARGATTLTITLSGIVNNLPSDLLSKVRRAEVGDQTISIPLDKILSQLAQGAVKISFGEIRQAAPQMFSAGAESDRVAVLLPLNEILTQINPTLLVRRPAQKQVEVPSDISSPFDEKGQGLVFSVGNAKPVSPAAPRQAVPAPATPARGAISSVPKPTPPPAASPISMPKAAAPPPARPAVPATPAVPFKSVVSNTPAKSVPAKPTVAPRAVSPAPPPAASAPPGSASVKPALRMPATPQPGQPKPVAAPLPVRPAANVETLKVPLNALTESWPDALRQEIAQTKLVDACLLLPCDTIESALKSGRAAFPWKTLRFWLQPASPLKESPNDNAELELPLKVVAPLFFARKNGAAQSKPKVTIDEAIPNLFFGFPGAETAPPPTSAAAAPPAAAPAATKAGPVTKPVDTNYYIWDDASDSVIAEEGEYRRKLPGGTDFVARYATPNEIVSRAAALDGVAGALIALPDGLMVASRIPAELNGDTLAAFLPQIFAKVNQCTRELRMGELNNLHFTVGNIPWKIFRVNAIFFAAFGRATEPMPTAGLAALAAELDRKQK